MNRNRNYNGQQLSIEQIQKLAPSAFAEQAHDSRSDRYAFVPTSAVIEGMARNGFGVFSALQSRTILPGRQFFTKHVLRFRSLVNNIVAVGDTFAELVLTNSHDGTSRYELALGSFRLVCENGAMVSEGLVQSIRIRHTGNIIDQVIEGSQNMIEQAPKLVEAISQWKSIMLSQPEQRILAEEAHSLRFSDSALSLNEVPAEALLTINRPADRGDDLWSVYNRIQENTIKGGLRYRKVVTDENGGYVRTTRNKTRAVSSIDEDNKLNKALWSLAEKMAALKA